MPNPAFDPVAATEALLGSVPPEAVARSNAYFEGGYWLLLWGALVSLAAAFALLHFHLAARLRDLVERVSPRPWLALLLFAPPFIVAITLLELPWAIYAGFAREHQYGFATQSFGAWLADAAVALAVSVVQLTPLIGVAYLLIRRAGRAWWAWAGGVAVAFLAFGLWIGPLYVEPLFNRYTPLEAGPLRDEILSLARANGIPSDDVLVVDASRQTTRISANVSGLFGAARIALNDNLLREGTPEEIRAVLGHEMGHYAMGHASSLLLQMGLLLGIGFLFADRAFAWALHRFGARWRVRGLADPAGLPILYAAFVVFFFAATPIYKTIFRVGEARADLFGLNAAREPDGFASVTLKLGSYRKLAPSRLEEALLFDHPSGKSRIEMAMRWKAEQLRAAAAAPAPAGKRRVAPRAASRRRAESNGGLVACRARAPRARASRGGLLPLRRREP
ncbi:MAG TPA: M48 family metalloprotease [Myxococcota bacterium]|nr:M48 family metalloprotease [Myxococcota bacterium]